METLNIFEATEQRDKGIKRAIEHAEYVELNWKDRALEYVRNYPGRQFRTEQVRVWASSRGLPEPPHKRSWGAVILAAKKLGMVRHVGYERTSDPSSRRTPVSLWEKI